MSWLDDFPVRSRDYELEVAVDAMADAREIADPEERRVGRALILNWATTGEADYRTAIAKTRDLLAEPDLELWIAKVASALERKGHLTGDQVEALRPDHLTADLQAAA